MASAKRTTIKVKGKNVEVSNLDKVFYPKTGFTKGEMLDYYAKIAPVLLSHLKSRALTLKRYPDGVKGSFFYEKQCPSHAPSWVKTTKVEKNNGEIIDYCLLNDLPSLIWAANIANLEIHTFLHKATAKTRPTGLVFDLDPGAPADVINCCEVALLIRDFFKHLKLDCYVKTSGSKGLQLMVPLNKPITYAKTKGFAKSLAQSMEQRFPDKVVSDMKKSLRKGKVFIDWSQNDDKKTTVCVYSLRAKDEPSVSTPLEWKEVEKALKKKDADLLKFSPSDALKRVEKHGDLFAKVLKQKQSLPAFSEE